MHVFCSVCKRMGNWDAGVDISKAKQVMILFGVLYVLMWVLFCQQAFYKHHCKRHLPFMNAAPCASTRLLTQNAQGWCCWLPSHHTMYLNTIQDCFPLVIAPSTVVFPRGWEFFIPTDIFHISMLVIWLVQLLCGKELKIVYNIAVTVMDTQAVKQLRGWCKDGLWELDMVLPLCFFTVTTSWFHILKHKNRVYLHNIIPVKSKKGQQGKHGTQHRMYIWLHNTEANPDFRKHF